MRTSNSCVLFLEFLRFASTPLDDAPALGIPTIGQPLCPPHQLNLSLKLHCYGGRLPVLAHYSMVHGGRSLADAVTPATTETAMAIVLSCTMARSSFFALFHRDRVMKRRRMRRGLTPIVKAWALRAEALRKVLLLQLDALHPTVGEFLNPSVHLWVLDPNQISPNLFKVNFRVHQRNFARLAFALKIPDFFVTENRSRFTGAVVFFDLPVTSFGDMERSDRRSLCRSESIGCISNRQACRLLVIEAMVGVPTLRSCSF